jgi:uncharacterized protein (TIGR00255 family)
MKSMTAYGSGRCDSDLGSYQIELSSLNRKNLEVHVYCAQNPRLEHVLRQWLTPYADRGLVHLRVILPNLYEMEQEISQLRKLKKAWDQVALELGYPPGQAIDLRFLLERLSERPQENLYPGEEVLRAAFDEAVAAWNSMREVEGSLLSKEIDSYLSSLEGRIAKIRLLFPEAIARSHEKLLKRLEMIRCDGNPERVEREVALIAGKWNIEEEVTRLLSHITQIRQVMMRQGSVGKVLDFLAQELQRELNTLGAKFEDLEGIRLVIEMKGIVENIREQFQNIA